MNFQALEQEIRGIGKDYEWTKILYTWKFIIFGLEYEISLTDSLISGKMIVRLQGKIILQRKYQGLLFLRRPEFKKFEYTGESFTFMITRNSEQTYELYIGQQRFNLQMNNQVTEKLETPSSMQFYQDFNEPKIDEIIQTNLIDNQQNGNINQQNFIQKGILIGAAIDMSGSMEEKFPRTIKNDLDEKKINSMFQLILDLIKDEKNTDDRFFTLAFGLKDYETCDLISLLRDINKKFEKHRETKRKLLELQQKEKDRRKEFDKMDNQQKQQFVDQEKRKLIELLQKFVPNPIKHLYVGVDGKIGIKGYEPLIALLQKNGVQNCQQHVKKYVDPKDAENFFIIFSQNQELLDQFIKDLPYEVKEKGLISSSVQFTSSVLGFFNDSANFVKKKALSEIDRAKMLANDQIDFQKETKNLLQKYSYQPPKLFTYQEVAIIFEDASKSDIQSDSKSETIVKKIQEYIYGETPLCETLRLLRPIYNNQTYIEKILMIFSDGESTDGNPETLCKDLKSQGVKIFSCFLSTSNLDHPRRLFHKPEANWNEVQKQMFNMSSLVPASHSSLVILRNEGWQIPVSGKCRLFAQVNHPDVVREFSNLAKRITDHDALLDVVGKISLEVYINKEIDNLEPHDQGQDGVCYAHAIATVVHLILSKHLGLQIVPQFAEFKHQLVQIYGKDGADTRQCLEEYCPKYGLKYQEVDEIGARIALINKRPVIAIFNLYSEQMDLFQEFFQNNRRSILEKSDLALQQPPNGEIEGHAVVLVRSNSNSLTFINSYGIQWGDNGFFRIKNAEVLGLRFFDVSLNEEQQNEIVLNLHKQHVQEEIQQLLQKVPKCLRLLPYECPLCHKEQQIEKFEGTIFKAKCFLCKQDFVPTGKDLLINLYTRSY